MIYQPHKKKGCESRSGYEQIIKKKGVPKAIYTDKAGWTGGPKRTYFSQFQRACGKLGIQLIFADSPEAKGRIERTFRTIQDRLIPELRLKKKELKMVFHSQPYFSKNLMDKKPYEETYDSNMNSYAEKPVSNVTEDFVKAFYQGDRLVVQSFDVEDSTYQKCTGKYSFNDFNCQKMEFSLGYDKSVKSYTWRRIGYWRNGNGSYQDDEFIMKKTK